MGAAPEVLDVIDELDIVIAAAYLPSGKGWWCPESRVILIDHRLTAAERCSTLLHEVAHALAGDAGTADWVQEAKQEARAELWAARKLLPIDALADGLRWAQDERELAADLGVDLDLLVCRLRTLSKAETQFIEQVLDLDEPECEGEVA